MKNRAFYALKSALFYSLVLLLLDTPVFAHQTQEPEAPELDCEIGLESEKAGISVEFHGRFFADLQHIYRMKEPLKEAPEEFASAVHAQLAGVPLDLKGESQFIVLLPLEAGGVTHHMLARTTDFGKTFRLTDIRTANPDEKVRVRVPELSEITGDLHATGWMKSEIPRFIGGLPFEKNSNPLYISILAKEGMPKLYVSYKDSVEKNKMTREVRDMRQSRDFLIEHSVAQKLLRKHKMHLSQLEEAMENWDGEAMVSVRGTRTSYAFIREVEGRMMIVHFSRLTRDSRPWILSAWFLDQYPRRMEADLLKWYSAEKVRP